MVTTQTRMTADDLFAMRDDGFRYELVEGELRQMPPAGFEHGNTAMSLTLLIGQYVRERHLGKVVAAETGFRIRTNPDTVRAPDMAFIRKECLPAGPLPKGYWPGAPDLAVEVISPNDTYGEVEEKVLDWLDCGTQMVIVVNPRNRTVTVYQSRTDVTVLAANDELTCDDVLPGFSCRIAELFG